MEPTIAMMKMITRMICMLCHQITSIKRRRFNRSNLLQSKRLMKRTQTRNLIVIIMINLRAIGTVRSSDPLGMPWEALGARAEEVGIQMNH